MFRKFALDWLLLLASLFVCQAAIAADPASPPPLKGPKPGVPLADAVVVAKEADKPKPINTIQMALFQAIAQEKSQDAIALLIKQNLDSIARPCLQVRAYQIYRFSTGERTLKVKCAKQPIYAVRVTADGAFIVLGGDGSVPDMLPSDGRVYSVFGETLKTYLDQEKVREKASHQGGTAIGSAKIHMKDAETAESAAWPKWLMIGNALLGLFALTLILRAILFRRKGDPDFAWGLNSMDKDMLMDESREVFPNVYRHPRGFFIARGRKGKRRLFRTALGGMLYRDLGLKIGELGE